jgi:copper chaperone CopZ
MNVGTFTRRMAVALSLVLVATGVLAAPPVYHLHVDGLSCPFCAYGLEKKLGAVPGVQGLETRIKDGILVVTMKDGMTLDAASAKQAVKEAGFSLRKMEQVEPAAQKMPEGQAK